MSDLVGNPEDRSAHMVDLFLRCRTMCIEMFGDDLTAIKSVIPYRGLKLWMTLKLLRRVIAKETWGHGIGRHSNEDVWKIAVQDMEALSHFLGKSFSLNLWLRSGFSQWYH